MNEMKRHIGKIRNTDRRCVVAFMQLPGREDHALVIDTEALPDRYHDALMEVVDSPDAQQSPTLATVLSRRIMPDTGADIMTTLHHAGYLMPVPVANIVMYPMPNMPFPLQSIIDANGGSLNHGVNPSQADQPYEKYNPVVSNQEAEASQGMRGMALNKLAEAELLEAEANRKREEAYRYDPSLRPQSKALRAELPATSANEPNVISADDLVSGDEAKRGRGRPKKAAA